jgi:outer membrane protein OmpA-like peptidoglycan-associated protein
VLVKGFFPAQSNTPENIKLSEERAVSVQQMMLAKGIAAEQIEVAGMGNLEPTGSNSTSDGQEQNHRVEVVVVKDGT